MKILVHVTCFFFAAVLLVSCASQNHIKFAGRYKPNTEVAKAQKADPVNPVEEIAVLPLDNDGQALASSGETVPDITLMQNRVQQTVSSLPLTEDQKAKLERKLDKVETKLEKRPTYGAEESQRGLNKGEKKSISSADSDDVLYAILAILLPPLAVALYEDGITAHFWISILLTLLFWIPGVIYALIIIFGG